MLDHLQRPLRDLRVSVTDRCNLRCRYCMPREVYGSSHRFLARPELLTFEEIARVVRVFARVGVSKVRLTGGEPLLRRELELLVAMLADIEGIDDLALTTNGLLLEQRARALADAGLTRVTVSLDALDDAVLASIADTPLSSARVLAGIDAALSAGLQPLKVNMVVRRGLNDHCVPEMAAYFRHRPVVLRFIEYMDVGSSNGWRPDQVATAEQLLSLVHERWPIEPLAPRRVGEVASRYRYLDGAGEIGVVHSVSKPFCGDCSRARLSADGQLFTCLFATAGSDLRALLREGCDEEQIEQRLRQIWGARDDRYSAERSTRAAADGGGADREPPSSPRVEMSYIGG